MESERADVVVVGGGLAGLAAAAILARAKNSVVLLERTSTLGGRAATHDVGGHRLNLGPHALYVEGRARTVLQELGVVAPGRMPSTRGTKALHQGVMHALPANAMSLLTSSLLSWREKIEVAKLLSKLPKIDASTFDATTVRDWIDAQTRSSRVRMLLEALVRVSTYANAPEVQSAGASIRQIVRALKGNVLYLDGGWQTLVDGLRDAALEAGAVVVASAKVNSVNTTKQGLSVCFGGGQRTVFTRHLLLAVSPSAAHALVPTSRFLAQAARDAMPIHAACLDVALSALPNARRPFALGIDVPYYASVHTAYAKLAPAGHAVIHVARYRSPGESLASDVVERELEDTLDRLQPGWRDVVVHRRFLPQMVVANAIARADLGGEPGRPDVRVADAERVWICGDWVGGEGMLADAALSSAARAAAAIALDLSRERVDPNAMREVALREPRVNDVHSTAEGIDYDALFRAHQRFLWGVAYRMTGSGADADDVVQQTFARALQSPPKDVDASWRPWLLRVTMNAARDALRRRKRRGYEGPWLPTPFETGDEATPDASSNASTDSPIDVNERADARYDLLESVTFAFLVALEELTPKQRAVLVLCDVLGYSVREAAHALETSDGAVKTTHHRARAVMSAYDAHRTRPTRELQQKTREALERFLFALARRDSAAVEAAVTRDVRAVSDGGGEFFAARQWIEGRERVTRFFLGIGRRADGGVRWEARMMNGMPAVVILFERPGPKEAPLVVQLCDVAGEGPELTIRALYSVLATKKLSAVRPP